MVAVSSTAPASVPVPKKASSVVLDGYNLQIPSVVAVARDFAPAAISKDKAVSDRIDASVKFLQSRLHQSIYGVTTGFGGSADTRTDELLNLQLALLEHQLCGVTPTQLDGSGSASIMPAHIVRGAILIRVQSLVRGHSAVRPVVLETLLKLLELDIIPVIPLRGSISASGDLSPLSFIAASICGHPDVRVIDRSDKSKPVVLFANEALKKHGIEPIVLGPKEGLGLINGTAVTCSAASLALHDSHYLSLLSQALTAMTVEAMNGMAGSFHEFIHDVTRPHPGQIESAANIRSALESSKLAVHEHAEVDLDADAGLLRQDRYPLRTAAQWIGPQLEVLSLAQQQVTVELSSTTDNPLMDASKGEIHHGGNFQAMSLSMAMETSRVALQNLGRLSFTQMTELVNCTMNRGLSSCLAGGEPSTNFHCKGLDIHAAAYQAELGFLANPVTSHVQSAEMHNQAVNSMGLVSARKTIEANEVLTLLMATHLYAVCQGIDLRVADMTFRAAVGKEVARLNSLHLSGSIGSDAEVALGVAVRDRIFRRLDQTTSLDTKQRAVDVAAFASAAVVDALIGAGASTGNELQAVAAWRKDLADFMAATQHSCQRDLIAGKLDVAAQLGRTRALYEFVRSDLGIKFRVGDVADGGMRSTIGRSVSLIVEGLATAQGREAIVRSLRE